jgi:hypothetical protein
MRGDGRYRLVVGLALGASLAFLAFLLARPVGGDGVKLVANLTQLLAASRSPRPRPVLDTVGTIPVTQPKVRTGTVMPSRITLVLID